MLDAMVRQLEKDLGLLDVQFDLPDDPVTAFDQLTNDLAQLIEIESRNNPERLFGALYRIDLPEKEFRAHWNPGDETSSSYHLAAKVLERELVKVVYRKLHS